MGTYRLRPVEAIQWTGTNRAAIRDFAFGRGLMLRIQGKVLWLSHQWFDTGPDAVRADPFSVLPAGWLVWDGTDIRTFTGPQFAAKYELEPGGESDG